MTTIYLIRHSRPFRDLLGEYNSNEQEQIRNEKNPLSGDGELRAKKLSEYNELQDVDIIFSSHYVRAMATAKYIAEKNNIKLNVDCRFGERKFGVKDMSELPKDFFLHQAKDWNYKIGDGESLNEVYARMTQAFKEILNKYRNKKIVVVSHGTALTTLLKKWCAITIDENTELFKYYFKGKEFFNGKWDASELFKLEFDEKNNLIDISNIKIKY